MQHGFENLVLRHTGLHKNTTPSIARSSKTCCSDQQRHGLFSGPVAGCQQLLIEVEERDYVCFSDSMQDSFSPDEQVARR